MADQDTTRIISRRAQQGATEQTETVPLRGGSEDKGGDDGHTKLFRPIKTKTIDQTAPRLATDNAPEADQLKVEPVVGWLVVLNGAGKGVSRQLYYGMNSIGRSSEEKVSIGSEDELISRKGHAFLTYDPKGRKFYIQHGGGSNLTYLNETRCYNRWNCTVVKS